MGGSTLLLLLPSALRLWLCAASARLLDEDCCTKQHYRLVIWREKQEDYITRM